MSYTGFRSLDNAAHKTSEWISELDAIYGWDNKQDSYHAFRAVLHTIRDRLAADEASQLAAQLPMVLRGMYFDGWSPSQKPSRWRRRDEFYEQLAAHFGGSIQMDPDEMAKGAFTLLNRHVSGGELDEVKSMLPTPVRELWP